MIKRWFDSLSIRWLTHRYGEGYPMFGWVLKDGPTLDLGIRRKDPATDGLLRSVSVRDWSKNPIGEPGGSNRE